MEQHGIKIHTLVVPVRRTYSASEIVATPMSPVLGVIPSILRKGEGSLTGVQHLELQPDLIGTPGRQHNPHRSSCHRWFT